jgi:myosin heavy subunit
MLLKLQQSDDPIERAGARLLHSAAIPIQKVIRGYLAKGEAMDRLWSIMLIQANIRRWLCQEAYEYTIFSATLIQAAFRGWRVRDQLDDQYYCATEIQRVFRGYLATMSVYEDLYNVTLIQSIVRMKLGMNEAARKRKTLRCSAATKIQSLWRKYVSQLSFQFDVVDIIIVQSIIRRRQVLSTFQQQQKAALVLQSTWRGFKCWADYVFTMADIVVSQRTVRQWLAVRRVNSQRKMMAAVVLIQVSLDCLPFIFVITACIFLLLTYFLSSFLLFNRVLSVGG